MGSSGSQTANLKCLPPYIGPPISLHRPTKQSFGIGIQNLNWRIGDSCCEQSLASIGVSKFWPHSPDWHLWQGADYCNNPPQLNLGLELLKMRVCDEVS